MRCPDCSAEIAAGTAHGYLRFRTGDDPDPLAYPVYLVKIPAKWCDRCRTIRCPSLSAALIAQVIRTQDGKSRRLCIPCPRHPRADSGECPECHRTRRGERGTIYGDFVFVDPDGPPQTFLTAFLEVITFREKRASVLLRADRCAVCGWADFRWNTLDSTYFLVLQSDY